MRSLVLILALSITTFGCDKKKDDETASKDDKSSSGDGKKKKKKAKDNPTAEFDGDEAGAKKLLEKFLDEDTDRLELTQALVPQDDDYEAVFKEDADVAKKSFQKLFEKNADAKIAPNAGQTELKLSSATSEELKDGEGNASKFPGGYKKIGAKLKKVDIAVSLHNGSLSVSGERKSETQRDDTEVYRAERFFGRFQRTVALPTAVAADKIKAQYKDGILTITLPKTEEAKPKQIDVAVS